MNINYGYFFKSHGVTADEEFVRMITCKQENKHHMINGEYTNVFEHTMKVLEALPEDSSEVLINAALLHDIGKPHTKAFKDDGQACFIGHAQKSRELSEDILLKRTNLNKQEIDEVLVLIETHDRVGGRKAIGKFYRKYGEEMTRRHLILRLADIMGQNPDPALSEPKLQEWRDAWAIYENLAEAEI